MRNPKESYDRIDSQYGIAPYDAYEDVVNTFIQELEPDTEYSEEFYQNSIIHEGILGDDSYIEYAMIGPKDMKLAQTLIKAGPEHRKFLRQIFVSVDITAPLYWY